VLATTAMLMMGVGAALLGALFDGSLQALQSTQALWVAGALGVTSLARRRH
jgi:hypothetical protein